MDNNTSNVTELPECNDNIDDRTESFLDLEPTLHMCFRQWKKQNNFAQTMPLDVDLLCAQELLKKVTTTTSTT